VEFLRIACHMGVAGGAGHRWHRSEPDGNTPGRGAPQRR
jgi:hypothetical protein